MPHNDSRTLDFVDFIFYDTSLDSLGIFGELGNIVGELDAYYDQSLITNTETIPMELYENIDIRPNPSDGLFNILLNNSKEGVSEIYDAKAMVIKSMVITTSDFQIPMDLREHPSGLYFVKFTNVNDQVVTSKLILE